MKFERQNPKFENRPRGDIQTDYASLPLRSRVSGFAFAPFYG